MNLRAARLSVLVAAVALAATVLPAPAQEAQPQPTSCAGTWLTDAAGDAQLVVGPLNSQQKTPANTDVIAAFWRYVPQGGKNVLTANIQVAEMNDAVMSGSFGSLWYVYFDIGDYTWFVNATLEGGAFTFGYGDLGETGPTNNTQGETTGKVFPGPKGIIQIVVPLDKIKPDGKTLANGNVNTKISFRNYIPTADRAPDGTAGAKGYKATPCAEGDTATPVTPGPAPAPSGNTQPAPTGDATGGGTQPPAQAPAETGPATLDLKVLAGKQSAKKIKRSRSMTVGLQAGEKITSLSAKLLKGKKALGSGSLAAVGPGSGKLKLKIAKKNARKFKKGTYTLSFSGTKADGRSASGKVQLRVTK